MTLAAYNLYSPITLAPAEVHSMIVESLVTQLPIFGTTILVRNMDPAQSVAFEFHEQLIVAGAPTGFNGTWENLIAASVIAPEQSVTLTVPVYSMDGISTRHRLVLTNPSVSASFPIHVLVNGMIDTIRTAPASTYLTIP
jgi:hypothetical protein